MHLLLHSSSFSQNSFSKYYFHLRGKNDNALLGEKFPRNQFIDTVLLAHSVWNRVYETSVRLCVCLSVRPSVRLSRRSTAAAKAGGFAAERPANRRYRSTAAGRH